MMANNKGPQHSSAALLTATPLKPLQGTVHVGHKRLVVAGAQHVVGVVQARPSPQVPRHNVLKTQRQVVAAVVFNQQPDEDRDKQRTGKRMAEREGMPGFKSDTGS